jgi:hypothetical protein
LSPDGLLRKHRRAPFCDSNYFRNIAAVFYVVSRLKNRKFAPVFEALGIFI